MYLNHGHCLLLYFVYNSNNMHLLLLDFLYMLNNYFLRLQEQKDVIASWSDSTISKLKSVIGRLLIETEYIDDFKADHLNPVWLNPLLENVIRSNHDEVILPAFNCFS